MIADVRRDYCISTGWMTGWLIRNEVFVVVRVAREGIGNNFDARSPHWYNCPGLNGTDHGEKANLLPHSKSQSALREAIVLKLGQIVVRGLIL